MKATILALLFVAAAPFVGWADSRAWPPSAFSLTLDRGYGVIRFEPKMSGREVVKTRILSFTYDAEGARFDLQYDREVPGFWEPRYVARAKNPDVLIMVFARSDPALVVIDTTNGKVITSKSLKDLVPELDVIDYRDRTTSTVAWFSGAYQGGPSIVLPGGPIDDPEDMHAQGPSFTVDLASFEITRLGAEKKAAQPGATDNPGDAQ